ncbi:MAG: hypothetical protein WA125_06265 [Desulfosporosinus sp.]
MGKEIQIQSKGEMEVVNNRKSKLDIEQKQLDLEKMIMKLTKRIGDLEGDK